MEIYLVETPFYSEEKLRDVLTNQTSPVIANVDTDDYTSQFKTLEALIADFDRTIALGNQWAHMEEHLPDSQKEAERKLREAMNNNHLLEGVDGDDVPSWAKNSTDTDYATRDTGWLCHSIMSWCIGGIGEFDLGIVGANTKLRKGTKELFDHFKKRSIVSFGVRDLIARCLAHHELTVDHIAAAKLAFSENGDIVGYDPRTLVTGARKGVIASRLSVEYGFDARHDNKVLVLGDSQHDLRMMASNRVNFLIVPKDRQEWFFGEKQKSVRALAQTVRLNVLFWDTWEPLNTLLDGSFKLIINPF